MVWVDFLADQVPAMFWYTKPLLSMHSRCNQLSCKIFLTSRKQKQFILVCYVIVCVYNAWNTRYLFSVVHTVSRSWLPYLLCIGRDHRDDHRWPGWRQCRTTSTPTGCHGPTQSTWPRTDHSGGSCFRKLFIIWYANSKRKINQTSNIFCIIFFKCIVYFHAWINGH